MTSRNVAASHGRSYPKVLVQFGALAEVPLDLSAKLIRPSLGQTARPTDSGWADLGDESPGHPGTATAAPSALAAAIEDPRARGVKGTSG
jgi:hypothetical protein